MSRKTVSILLVLVLILSVTVGCGDNTTSGGGEQYISIATGGTSGTYYPLGGAIAKIFNDNIDNVTANAQSTGASVENIGLVSKGETEVAFIQSDITFYASEGIENFADTGKVENIRGMAMLYPEVVQIVANASANINSVQDLKGKKVAVGAPGSGTEANARQILGAHGITYDDLSKADYLSFGEAADQLKDGHIDAAFVTAGLPTSALVEVSTSNDIVVVPIEKAKIAELAAEYPFYTEVTIPGGTYRNNDSDVLATAVMAMLVVPEDLDDDLMYEMTKSLFEQRQVIIDTHDRGNDIKLETAIVGMPIELHPGAARYYEEAGIK
ncbi:MAG: TAXI family TRAP transporter solute-binding subunit [Tissierellaceae bacterium]|nr:TAXI family TRAP transporter solute-binding subunit [Tissierellaceae bacterium]